MGQISAKVGADDKPQALIRVRQLQDALATSEEPSDWLKRIPDTVQILKTRWSLTIDEPFANSLCPG